MRILIHTVLRQMIVHGMVTFHSIVEALVSFVCFVKFLLLLPPPLLSFPPPSSLLSFPPPSSLLSFPHSNL